MPIDNPTDRFGLKLPNEANTLKHDVQRLIDSFETLDDKAAKLDDSGKLLPSQYDGDHVAILKAPHLWVDDAVIPSNIPRKGADGKIDDADLHDDVKTVLHTAVNEIGMTELSTATPGDFCHITQPPYKTYILCSDRPEIRSAWGELIPRAVTSVNGKWGDVKVAEAGDNSDITSLSGLKGPLSLGGDGQADFDAVTLRQLRTVANAGAGGGASMSGVMNNFIGAVEWFNGPSRAVLPGGHVAADGQCLACDEYPDLWAAVQNNIFASVSNDDWIAGVTVTDATYGKVTVPYAHRGKYSKGGAAGTCPDKSITGAWFRVPDLNGVQPGSASGLFLRGSGNPADTKTVSMGTVSGNSLPDIQGRVTTNNGWMFTGATTGAIRPSGATSPNAPTTAATTIPTQAYLDFKASWSNGVYGAVSAFTDLGGVARVWTASEVRPPQAVGIWIIRANGAFSAPATTFDVIRGDAAPPGAGKGAVGGVIRSIYQIAGADVYRSTMYLDGLYGARIATTISCEDVQVANSRGTLSVDNNGQVVTASASALQTGVSVGKLTVQRQAQIANPDIPGLDTCFFYSGDSSTAPGIGKPFNYWMGMNIAEGYHTGQIGNYSQLAFPMAVDAPPKFRHRIAQPNPRFTDWYSFLAQNTNTKAVNIEAFQTGWDGPSILTLGDVSNNAGGFVKALSWHSSSGANGSNYPIRATLGTIANGTTTWPDVCLRMKGDAGWWTNYRFASGGKIYGENIINGSNGDNTTASWEFHKDPGSDARLKTDIQDFDGFQSLQNIEALEFKTFRFWPDSMKPDVLRRGIIAQQAMTVDPEYVHAIPKSDGGETLALDINVLLLDALAAIKVLSAEVKDLKAQLAAKA